MHPSVRDCAYFPIGTSKVAVTASAGLYCCGGETILHYCTWEVVDGGQCWWYPRESKGAWPSISACDPCCVPIPMHSSFPVGSKASLHHARLPQPLCPPPAESRVSSLQSTVAKAQQVR